MINAINPVDEMVDKIASDFFTYYRKVYTGNRNPKILVPTNPKDPHIQHVIEKLLTRGLRATHKPASDVTNPKTGDIVITVYEVGLSNHQLFFGKNWDNSYAGMIEREFNYFDRAYDNQASLCCDDCKKRISFQHRINKEQMGPFTKEFYEDLCNYANKINSDIYRFELIDEKTYYLLRITETEEHKNGIQTASMIGEIWDYFFQWAYDRT